MMGIRGFKASRAWVTRFRRRHGLVYVRLRGERASADGDAARKYAFTFTNLGKELKVKTSNMYNFDERLIYLYVTTSSTLCPQDMTRTIRADGLRLPKPLLLRKRKRRVSDSRGGVVERSGSRGGVRSGGAVARTEEE